MAQRTGALGLLALALVTAVISGCGGGSSSSSAPTSVSADAGRKAPAQSNGQAAKASEGQKAETGESTGAESKGDASKPRGSSGAVKGEPKGPALGKSGYRGEEAETEPEKNIPVTTMTLFSPEINNGSGSGQLPTKFTCNGKDVWPSLTWNTPPEGTQELVLFALNIQPVEGKLFYDWAVAGISPSTTEIPSGELPSGAVLGKTSNDGVDYSICPKAGTEENFIFQLFAIPKKLGAKQGFDPTMIRAQALELAPNAGLLSVYSG